MSDFVLGVRQKRLLREAMRRYKLRNPGNHTGGQTLTTAWTGLGSATEYAAVVNAGYMEPATSLNPGSLVWWRLTEKGVLAIIFLGWIEGDDSEQHEAG